MEKLLTTEEVSTIMGLENVTVYKLSRLRILPKILINWRSVRFRLADVEAICSSQEGVTN